MMRGAGSSHPAQNTTASQGAQSKGFLKRTVQAQDVVQAPGCMQHGRSGQQAGGSAGGTAPPQAACSIAHAGMGPCLTLAACVALPTDAQAAPGVHSGRHPQADLLAAPHAAVAAAGAAGRAALAGPLTVGAGGHLQRVGFGLAWLSGQCNWSRWQVCGMVVKQCSVSMGAAAGWAAILDLLTS